MRGHPRHIPSRAPGCAPVHRTRLQSNSPSCSRFCRRRDYHPAIIHAANDILASAHQLPRQPAHDIFRVGDPTAAVNDHNDRQILCSLRREDVILQLLHARLCIYNVLLHRETLQRFLFDERRANRFIAIDCDFEASASSIHRTSSPTSPAARNNRCRTHNPALPSPSLSDTVPGFTFPSSGSAGSTLIDPFSTGSSVTVKLAFSASGSPGNAVFDITETNISSANVLIELCDLTGGRREGQSF